MHTNSTGARAKQQEFRLPYPAQQSSRMKYRPYKQRVLARVQASIPLTCLLFAADNLLSALKLSNADPHPDDHLSGAHLDADLAYAEKVADTYFSRGPIRGQVAEVGPGGSAAVALHLLARGCSSVDLVDRFAFSHNPSTQKRLYEAIIKLEPRLRQLGIASGSLDPYVKFFVGDEAAAEVFFRTHHGYDAIVSCAVLEHLYDPLTAVEAMFCALRRGGQLLHQVDLRDHGMFSTAGHHELTFLTIPGWIYPHMSRRRGRPNRILVNRYRETLERLKAKYELLVTDLVGVGPIEPAKYDKIPHTLRRSAEERVEQIRSKLAPEFRYLPAADLAVASVFISAIAAGD